MAVNQSFNLFPLLSEAGINENTRPGTIMLEYFQASVTTSSDTGDVEVPTQLDDCLGIIPLQYCDEFGSADFIESMSTDAVITTGAVTVRVVLSAGGTDGAHVVRGFLVGTKRSTTVLLNNPA